MVGRFTRSVLPGAALLATATAAAAPVTDSIGNKPLPVTAVPACEESVHGFSGVNEDIPMSIVWKSYRSSQPVHDIVRYYETVLRRSSVTDKSEGHIWRLDDGLMYRVIAAARDLPWLQCIENPSGIASVILVSRMHSAR